MSKYLDRTGEENYNNFGSKMIITEYKNCENINVFFPEYNWTINEIRYDNFKNGNIKCPYEKRYYGIGFIGEGKFKTRKNDKNTRVYDTWKRMLERCYSEKFHEINSTYKGCEVEKDLLNFQNFAKWYYDNYYEIEGQIMELDKDILVKGNKIYSPETCVFVPHNINSLFIKRDNKRGEYPIGVSYNKRNKKFVAKCNVYDFENKKKKTKHLGYYDAPEDAFNSYKQFKEKHIKEVADYYKDKIPQKLYDAMYQYEVEITD